MTLSVKTLSETEYPLWNEFVRKSPQGTFFNTTEWANLLSFSFDRDYRIIAVINNDEIISGCLVFVQQKFGYNLITPQAIYPFNGPVLTSPADAKIQKVTAVQHEVLSAIAGFLRQQYHYWILDTTYHLQDVRAFQWAGCSCEPVYSYQVNISDWETCLAGLSQSVRKKVRQAEQSQFRIEKTIYSSSFIDLYQKSYQRHGLTPLIKSQTLEKFLDMAMKLDQVTLYYLYRSEVCLAGRIVLTDTPMVYDLLAGSDDPDGLGSSYLVYNILKDSAGINQIFDFLGADHPQIEKFKRSFGGTLVHGFRLTNKPAFPLSWLIKLRTRQLIRDRIK